jgi:hypothetical protein
MASSFSPKSQILDLGPRAHAWWVRRQDLLWPAWMHRVAAPRPTQSKLNTFQRAVLGLAYAGVIEADAVAQRLHIHGDLVAHIMLRELVPSGYLDRKTSLPTEFGVEALASDAAARAEMKTGFVFRDPFDGKLWPRFVEQIQYADVDYESDPYPLLVQGTAGAPIKRRPELVFPPQGALPIPPEPLEVLDAVRAQSRWAKAIGRQLTDEDEVLSLPTDALKRVTLLDAEPDPVFLVTYAYLTDDDDRQDWFVCDPFGLMDSPLLKRRLVELSQDRPRLSNRINNLLRKARDFTDLEGWGQAEELFKEMARDAVVGRLGVQVEEHPAFSFLRDMEENAQKADLDTPKSTRGGEKVVKDLLRDARSALEATTLRVLKLGPVDGLGAPVQGLRRGRKSLVGNYTAIAQEMGADAPLPRIFMYTTGEDVDDMCRRLSHGKHVYLAPSIVLMLMQAHVEAAHPLRTALASNSALMHQMLEVAEAGNLASHPDEEFAGSPSDWQRAIARETRERTYGVVESFGALG